MSPTVLKVATAFGGSLNFNNREGIGRYGMGMKTAALSMSPVLELYSWQEPSAFYNMTLDVEAIGKAATKTTPTMDARAGITHSVRALRGPCFQHHDVLLLVFALVLARFLAFLFGLFFSCGLGERHKQVAICALSLMGAGMWIGSYFSFSPGAMKLTELSGKAVSLPVGPTAEKC